MGEVWAGPWLRSLPHPASLHPTTHTQHTLSVPCPPPLQLIAVEPTESPVISGGTHTNHLIQGMGAGGLKLGSM